MRETGIKISLDDFGTGFWCLADLRRLPIDQIKIDKSFVESLETDSGPIVKVIVATAQTHSASRWWPSKETIQEGKAKNDLAADLALVTAAQKVKHYEISGYGTLRSLARQIGEREVATLLSHTLGEEESADFLLTNISQPLIQQASAEDYQAAGGHPKTAKTLATH